MEAKQPGLIEELRRRVAAGVYTGALPTSHALADEFGVNVKTMNKALRRLAAEGLLDRRRRGGTRVKTGVSPASAAAGGRLVEVVFEGFTTIFTHPFWAEIWSGLVTGLAAAGYRPALTLLTMDPETGLLPLDGFATLPAAGRVALGISEKSLLARLKDRRTPLIAACDPVEEFDVPQVTFDFTEGMEDAVAYLAERGCEAIGFVGRTQIQFDRGELHKYDAFRRALERRARPDARLVAHARPELGEGEKAVAAICRRKRPDALVAAHDHQVPEIVQWLGAHGLTIPVVGCDGLPLAELPGARPVVTAPRRRCGTLLAENLVRAIATCRRPRSQALPATFACYGTGGDPAAPALS